jgi:hypothetical protein
MTFRIGISVFAGLQPNPSRIRTQSFSIRSLYRECSMVADTDSKVAWHRAQLKKNRAALKQIETARFTVGESADARALERTKTQVTELQLKIRESEQVIGQHDKQARRPLATDLRSLSNVAWRNWTGNGPR